MKKAVWIGHKTNGLILQSSTYVAAAPVILAVGRVL